MPSILSLKTIAEERGNLTIIEKSVPFPVKRIFYTYRVPVGTIRGKHAHRKSRIALVSLAGSCVVSGDSPGGSEWAYTLSDPATCLVLEPREWHQMKFLEPVTVLLCLASEEYDPDDYIYERNHSR